MLETITDKVGMPVFDETLARGVIMCSVLCVNGQIC